MKRLLLLPALLLGSASFAADAKYEISPMVGYNFSEGNIQLKDDGFFTGGVEVQVNSSDSKLSPEVSLFYTHNADYTNTSVQSDIARAAINGVYTFDPLNKIIPFVKLGAGYEAVKNDTASNRDGLFADAGAGIKVPFSDSFAFKAEAIYLAKIARTQNEYSDNNLITLVGLTYSFGAMKQKAAPVAAAAVAAAAVVESDSDGDGVYDKLDKCPNTPAGSTVGADGCPINMDDDNDGVLNSNDLCPNTPAGQKVMKSGCPAIINLHINFERDSAKILPSADTKLDKYAAFLTKNRNYAAKIVGYTDSRASAAYNKKLSQRRAEAVVAALIQRGVKPEQLSASYRYG